jgi:hypothetical protein
MIKFLLEGYPTNACFRNEYVVVKLEDSEILFSFNSENDTIEYKTNKSNMDCNKLDELANFILLNYLDDIIFDLEYQESLL